MKNGLPMIPVSYSDNVNSRAVTNHRIDVVNNLKSAKIADDKKIIDSFCSSMSSEKVLDCPQDKELSGLQKIFKFFGGVLSGLSSDLKLKESKQQTNAIKKLDKLIVSENTGKATRLPTIAELEKCGLSIAPPEFLYHMTSKKNYEAMLATGKLEQGFDHYCGKAVFAFDSDNFTKNWNNILDSDVCMKDKLLKQAAKFGDDVVLLKIPTSVLNKDKMFVRSENVVFDKLSANIYDKRDIQNFVLTPENRKLMDARITTFGDLFLKRTRELILQNENPLTASHLLGETPVEYAPLLDYKGEPVEYLYRDDIPISSVVKLGEVTLSDYKDLSVKDRVKNAYLKLFQCEC